MKTRLGTKLRFYFDQSLTGYFVRRAKAKWFTPVPPIPCQVNYRGVKLQVAGLSAGMQKVLITGKYEVPEMKLVPGFICASDRVLELGGAIGFLGLYCLTQIGIKKCTTVEPNPNTVSYLMRNYELNMLTPTLIQAAITGVDGPVPAIGLQTSALNQAQSLKAVQQARGGGP